MVVMQASSAVKELLDEEFDGWRSDVDCTVCSSSSCTSHWPDEVWRYVLAYSTFTFFYFFYSTVHGCTMEWRDRRGECSSDKCGMVISIILAKIKVNIVKDARRMAEVCPLRLLASTLSEGCQNAHVQHSVFTPSASAS